MALAPLLRSANSGLSPQKGHFQLCKPPIEKELFLSVTFRPKTTDTPTWRKRLAPKEPVRFALVERGAARQAPATDAALELVLASGERLRIGNGVNAATLRTVLDVLRG